MRFFLCLGDAVVQTDFIGSSFATHPMRACKPGWRRQHRRVLESRMRSSVERYLLRYYPAVAVVIAVATLLVLIVGVVLVTNGPPVH